jgi:hypothetical protein
MKNSFGNVLGQNLGLPEFERPENPSEPKKKIQKAKF